MEFFLSWRENTLMFLILLIAVLPESFLETISLAVSEH